MDGKERRIECAVERQTICKCKIVRLGSREGSLECGVIASSAGVEWIHLRANGVSKADLSVIGSRDKIGM